MASLTSIRSCADRIEAESIRIRLAEAGIRAFITGTDMETALGLGGAGTMRLVRVEVPSDEAERATAILLEDERKAIEAGPWICSRCREQNEATFEVCWSCSKPRTDKDERGRLDDTGPATPTQFSETITSEPTEAIEDDGNPYRPVATLASDKRIRVPKGEAPASINDDVTRAFRAAVIGLLVFPPLVCLYSFCLLLTLPTAAYRDRSLQVKLVLTWILNIVFTIGWTLFWINSFR